MMKNTTMAIVLLLSVTISCNQKNNINTEVDNEESVFVEVNRTQSNFEKTHRYRYFYKGEYKNKSSYIFDEVMIHMSVEFVLENGNIITKKDYSDGGFLSGSNSAWIKVWKSNETISLGDKSRNEFHSDRLQSELIPLHFKDYPIKQVIAVFDFETTDLINQTKNTYISSIDITKEWNQIK